MTRSTSSPPWISGVDHAARPHRRMPGRPADDRRRPARRSAPDRSLRVRVHRHAGADRRRRRLPRFAAGAAEGMSRASFPAEDAGRQGRAGDEHHRQDGDVAGMGAASPRRARCRAAATPHRSAAARAPRPAAAGGSASTGTNSPTAPSIGYRISVPIGCAKRAVGTRLAIRKPSDSMLSVLKSSASGERQRAARRASTGIVAPPGQRPSAPA